MIHPRISKSIQLTEDEEIAITKIGSKCYQLNAMIENLEKSISNLDKLTNENEIYLTTTFDDLISSTKLRKKQSIQKFNDIISYKKLKSSNKLTI